MTPLAVFIWLATFIILIVGITISVIINRNRQQLVMTTKHVTNLLCKYNNGRKYGGLVYKKPIGFNKEFLKIIYLTKYKNEYNELENAYETVIAKKNKILETDNELIIFPKEEKELEDDENPFNGKYKKIITASDNIETQAEAERKSKDKFVRLYRDNYGGELSIEVMQKFMDMLSEKKDEEKNGSEKK